MGVYLNHTQFAYLFINIRFNTCTLF